MSLGIHELGVLGHSLVIIPFHDFLLHSASIKSAKTESGLRTLVNTDYVTDW